MAAPVFVSHSSKDREIVVRLCHGLETRGISCWISSRDVAPGENYQEAIVRAIGRARVMILVFTQNANNSDEIKKEISLASQHKLTVIPVRVEDVVPSAAFAYELATRQWINMFDDWDAAINRLRQQVAAIVTEPPAVMSESSLTPAPDGDPARSFSFSGPASGGGQGSARRATSKHLALALGFVACLAFGAFGLMTMLRPPAPVDDAQRGKTDQARPVVDSTPSPKSVAEAKPDAIAKPADPIPVVSKDIASKDAVSKDLGDDPSKAAPSKAAPMVPTPVALSPAPSTPQPPSPAAPTPVAAPAVVPPPVAVPAVVPSPVAAPAVVPSPVAAPAVVPPPVAEPVAVPPPVAVPTPIAAPAGAPLPAAQPSAGPVAPEPPTPTPTPTPAAPGVAGLQAPIAPPAPSPPPKVAKAPPPIAEVGDGGQVFQECESCAEMVVIPAGTTFIGSPAEEPERRPDEGPRQQVRFAAPFAVGRYEVSFAEWDACVAAGGCNNWHPGDYGWGRGEQPVIFVSWNDAHDYAAWLSSTTGQPYRLLSEAEYEYVARACRDPKCQSRIFWFGDKITPEVANYNSQFSYAGSPKANARRRTLAVGAAPANPFGLYHILGNVRQWVADCWNPSLQGLPPDGRARLTGDCNAHVVRGGSWSDGPVDLRASARSWDETKTRSSQIGFRIARDLMR